MSTPAPDMTGKVVLITGATAGIGKETVVGLLRMGATVVLVSRERERGEAALQDVQHRTNSRNVVLMTCDLSSQRSIRVLADEFSSKYSGLDVLINNAGVFMTRRSITEDGIESTFAINHLAYFLLSNLLLERLKARAPSRIVNVASAAHHYGHLDFTDLQRSRSYSSFGAYAASKLANILFTRELARRLEGTAITVNCLHPGTVGTNLFRRLPGFLESIIKLVTISPERGARTSIYLASSPDVDKVSGKYFSRSRETSVSREARNDDLAEKLWLISEELTGLRPQLEDEK